jgi:uncharacterized ion transporter superfamily protein YfcC
VQSPSFFTLLYRYFFFGWLFKDTDQSDVFQRAAAFRHNHEQTRWLPTYARRWIVLGLLLYALAGYTEILLGLPELAAFFYLPAALFVPVGLLIGAAWLCMKAIPKPPVT